MKERDRGAERIVRYLRDRADGATSEEIARDVLHLAATAPRAQERIVESLLRNEEGVERGRERRWTLNAGMSGTPDASYVAAAVRVSRETREIIAIGLRKMGEDQELLDLDRDRDWDSAPERVAAFLEFSILVTFDQQNTARALGKFTESVPGVERPPVLSLQRLGKRLLGLKRHPSLHELCDRFGVTQNVEGPVAAEVETLADIFGKLRDEAGERGLTSPEDILGVQERRPLPVD